MKKPIDPKRLQISNYPFRHPLETQFGDMDVAGHINNLSVGRYYESVLARFHLHAFNQKDLFTKASPYTIVLAETCTTYLAECNYPDPVEVGLAVKRIGNSSYTVLQALFQNDVCVGLSESIYVLTSAGKTIPFPADVCARLEAALFPETD